MNTQAPKVSSSSPSSPRLQPPRTNAGLAGVVVADTRLSRVDGQRGKLTIAGKPLAEVAALGFEGLCARLWQAGDAERLRRRLGAARVEVFAQRPRWQAALQADEPMAAVRAGMLLLTQPRLNGEPEWPHDALRLTAAAAVIAAAWGRQRNGHEMLPPQADSPHSRDYLHMLGTGPGVAEGRALDAYLCTVSEHGMNASTFTARTVTSTRADATSAIVAAIGALKGPLHGGAPGPVLDMLDAVQAHGDATAWLRAELAAGRRIMGMGHRVYRTRDPRAAALETALLQLDGAPQISPVQTARSAEIDTRITLARDVERSAEQLLAERFPQRPLRANVEFYTAVLLERLAIPRDMFAVTFAVARVAGWCAHIAEQRAVGTLIRPSVHYVGWQA